MTTSHTQHPNLITVTISFHPSIDRDQVMSLIAERFRGSLLTVVSGQFPGASAPPGSDPAPIPAPGEVEVHACHTADGQTSCGKPVPDVVTGEQYNCTGCILANERGEKIREYTNGLRDSGIAWYLAEVTRQVRDGRLRRDQLSNSTASLIGLPDDTGQPAPASTAMREALTAAVGAAGIPRILEHEIAAAGAPAIGDVVHYVSYGTPGGEYNRECLAAVITEVRDHDPVPESGVPYSGMCVLNPTGQFFNREVRYDEGKPDNANGTNLCGGLDFKGGTWHWPAR